MKDELDKRLCEKYPKIFRDRHASMQETCMCWGFAHGDGWYDIVESLCSNIQNHVDWKRRQHHQLSDQEFDEQHQVVAAQVKSEDARMQAASMQAQQPSSRRPAATVAAAAS